MNLRFLLAPLAFTATTATADTASVVQSILGKNLTNDQVSESVISADGTLSGVYSGTAYSGTWDIRDGKYCRAIPAFNVDGCQDVVALANADGEVVAVEFRNPGEDSGNRYTIN